MNAKGQGMSNRKRLSSSIFTLFLWVLSLGAILSSTACGAINALGTPKTQPTVPAPTAAVLSPADVPTTYFKAEVTFNVELPANTPVDAPIDISVLDEVSGLAMNSQDFRMEMVDPLHYTIRLPLSIGSVVKYRYFQEGNPPKIEFTPSGNQVRYRLAVVGGPESFQDTISAWKTASGQDHTGKISGEVVDEANGSPVPSLLVTAGGQQAVTDADGSFVLNGLPAGTHNLVVYAMDGKYRPFQQGATVAAGLTTPAKISVSAAPKVNVTFNVTLPKENVVGLPVRMAGNLLSLGNAFADLSGGLSAVASRMPLLSQLPDGRYSITLELPTGTDLTYKYTLGDGFWNAELTTDGNLNLRELIVPDHDIQVEDQIASWRSPNFEPITFEVKAPADAQTGDTVSIQLNPYDWTIPMPMWSLGDGRWLFILYNPLHMVGTVSYRFCRNDQCDYSGASGGLSFNPDAKPQSFQYDITSWNTLN